MSKYKIITVNLSFIFILCVGILGFSGALSVANSSINANTTQRFLPIYSVETNEKKVAITFDAAWSDADTAELISILRKHNARATFFCVGDYVRKYPEAVKAFYDNNHEIGNHSNTHKIYTEISADEIKQELFECNKEIENIIGIEPVICRAPSGAYNNSCIEIAENMGMKTIQWDIDSRDWKKLPVNEMYENIISNTNNGSIILFHNGIENTPKTLDLVLGELKKCGYKFVTVSDLIYKENYEIDSNGKQKLIIDN